MTQGGGGGHSADAPGAEARRFSIRDVVAGVSVGLVLIPQSMAYAELMGMPAHYGLYASALPPIAAALFASSPYLQTGPVALTALLSLGALAPLVAVGSPQYIAMAALLALMVGIVRVLVGLVRAGGVSYLMSQPVLMGFTSGAALLILASQLPGAMGVGDLAPDGGVLSRAFWALGHVGAWEWTSVIMASGTVAIIFGARRINPLVPGVLVATLGGLTYSILSAYQGPIVGMVPEGFPTLSLAMPWASVPALFVPAIVIALVGFAEAASISRTFATEERSPWDPSREFISQGAANLASAVSGGFPVGGSFSRSSINRLAGARTRWSGAVTGLVVVAFLPFASVLAPLPRAILSAIVISGVWGLIKLSPLVAQARLSRPQAIVGFITFGLTLALAPRVDQAILVGVVLSLAIHTWREMHPRVEAWIDGDALHIRPHGVLWFGSTPVLEQEIISRLPLDPDAPDLVCLHLRGLGRIDLTGAVGLKQIVDDAELAGIRVELVEVPPHADRILGRVLGWDRKDSSSLHGPDPTDPAGPDATMPHTADSRRTGAAGLDQPGPESEG